MNKTKARKELENIYYQSLVEGILDEEGTWIGAENDKGEEYIDIMTFLEEEIYGTHLDPKEETTSTAPWKKAYKRFEEIKDSPLFAAMREEE